MPQRRSSPPPTGRSRADSTKVRREQILAAALRKFVKNGYTQTSIEDVRAASGASIGSLYHHFGGKPGIAAALYVDGIERYQEAMLDALERAPDSASAIRGIVRRHFDWIVENGDVARFLFSWPDREVLAESGAAVRKLNRRFAGRFEEWLTNARRRGEIGDVDPQLIEALLIGSCTQLTRVWLREGLVPDDDVIEQLGDLIWAGLTSE